MATKSNKPAPTRKGGATRRETLEAMRRDQKSRERRKTFLVVGVAGALGLGLIAAATVPADQNSRNDPKNKAIASFGVPAAEAGCDPATTDKTSGSNVHVEAGTKIHYGQVPPSSGKHYGEPAPFARKFYTVQDRPPIEQLVHNLEHGYTVLWYASDASDAERQALEGLAERVPEESVTAGKFLVSPWDDAYGKFPKGKRFALSHWGAEAGSRQLCGNLSGEVVETFIQAHPASDAPESGAA